ncbi:hypothetical protein B7486_17310 [cyanobacterium TDX16]|nr:hypothetical protein B7486_17310 [cyanobacterium TDX16]
MSSAHRDEAQTPIFLRWLICHFGPRQTPQIQPAAEFEAELTSFRVPNSERNLPLSGESGVRSADRFVTRDVGEARGDHYERQTRTTNQKGLPTALK